MTCRPCGRSCCPPTRPRKSSTGAGTGSRTGCSADAGSVSAHWRSAPASSRQPRRPPSWWPPCPAPRPGPPPAAPPPQAVAPVVTGQEVLLAAATVAERTPAGTGKYWHVKITEGTFALEFWTTADGHQWYRGAKSGGHLQSVGVQP